MAERRARMAKLADAADLKSADLKRVVGVQVPLRAPRMATVPLDGTDLWPGAYPNIQRDGAHGDHQDGDPDKKSCDFFDGEGWHDRSNPFGDAEKARGSDGRFSLFGMKRGGFCRILYKVGNCRRTG